MHFLLHFLLLASFVSPIASAQSYEQCLHLAEQVAAKGGKITSPVPQDWTSSQFSDPKHHDPNHFVYIVHGVGSDHYDLRDLELGQRVDYSWVSIISNDAPFTYMRESGLILAIEPDNVISNSCYDTVYTFHIKDARMRSKEIQEGYDKYIRLHRQLTPEQMLSASLWPRWMDEDSVRENIPFLVGGLYQNNELLLKGRSESGSAIRTIGVYINAQDTYPPTIEALKEFAKKFQLPIIEIYP